MKKPSSARENVMSLNDRSDQESADTGPKWTTAIASGVAGVGISYAAAAGHQATRPLGIMQDQLYRIVKMAEDPKKLEKALVKYAESIKSVLPTDPKKLESFTQQFAKNARISADAATAIIRQISSFDPKSEEMKETISAAAEAISEQVKPHAKAIIEALNPSIVAKIPGGKATIAAGGALLSAVVGMHILDSVMGASKEQAASTAASTAGDFVTKESQRRSEAATAAQDAVVATR